MPPNVNVAAKAAASSAQHNGGTWESTFPADFEKPSESITFMTRLLYVSFSHILQSRRLVPSTAFKKRVIDGCVRSYVPNLKDDVGVRLSSKLRGASQAAEKGFLDELIIVVNPAADNEDVAIEVFKWKMHYHENNECSASILDSSDSERLSIRYTGLESSKKKTVAMLQAVRYLCCELLGPLPPSASANLMITYTDDAPKGYQAEGFHRCPTMYNLDSEARSVNLSVIATPHHTISLYVESVCVEDEYAIKAKLDERSATNLSLSLNSTLDDSFSGGNVSGSVETRAPEIEVVDAPVVSRSKSNKRKKSQTVTPEGTFTSTEVDDGPVSTFSKKSRTSIDREARRTPGLSKNMMMAKSPHIV